MISSDRITEPIRSDEPRSSSGAAGLSYESDDPELAQEAQVLLLAQSDGYRAAGDPAGVLHLVQQGLTLDGAEPQNRERLLNSGVELAVAISELKLARQYAAESVSLTERRASPDDPDAQRDFSIGLGRLGDVTRELGDPATATTYYQQALDIRRRLAEQLGTARALQDLQAGLTDLARTEEELGSADAAAALRAELATVSDQLAALNDDPSSD